MMLTEDTVREILHTAAYTYADVDDPDMRDGILLVTANLLLPEVEDVHAMTVLRHAFLGVIG